METISNIAGAAKTAVLGQGSDTKRESGQEPVSGLQGAGKPDDPYDGGNRQEPGMGGAAGSNAQPVFGGRRDNSSDNEPYQRSQPGTGSYQDTPSNDSHRGPRDQGNDQSVFNQNEYTTGTAYEPSSLAGPDRDGSSTLLGSGAASSSSTYNANDTGTSTSAASYAERLPDQYTASSAGVADPSRPSGAAATDDNSSYAVLASSDHTGPRSAAATAQRDPTDRTAHETEQTGSTALSGDPKPRGDYPNPSSADADSTGGRAGLGRGAVGGFSSVEPSVGADPSSAQKPTLKHQGADRPHEEPAAESLDAIRAEKAATERALHAGSHGGPQEQHSEESKGTDRKSVV